MHYNLMIFGFPVYLIFFEILFRTFSNLDTSSFIGPTLGAAGLGFLLPLLKLKPVALKPEDVEEFNSRGLIIKNTYDEKFIAGILIVKGAGKK